MPEILLDAAVCGKFEETPFGFLRTNARLGAEGVVTYKLPGGKVRREYRPADEVVKLDSLQSYEGAPVAGRHPYDEPSQLLLPENIRKHMVGVVGDSVKGTKVDGVAVVEGTITLFDADEIQAAKDGKIALSPGYLRRLDVTPGEWTDPRTGKKVAYDAIQRDIRVNHVVTCAQGRQGPLVKLMMDSEDVQFLVNLDAVEVEPVQKRQGALKMKKVKVGGVEFDAVDEVAARLDALESEKTAAETKAATAEASRLDAVNKAAEEKGKADAALKAQQAAEAKASSTPSLDSVPVEVLHKAAESRFRIISTAKSILAQDQHAGLSKLSDLEIMRKVVACDSPDTSEEDMKQAPYVKARFDALVDLRKKAGKVDDQISEILGETRQAVSDEAARATAREERKKALNERWKQPIGEKK